MTSLNSSSKPWGVRFRKALQMLGGTLGVLLLSLPLFSQGNFGRILGTVTDTSGGVVAGATVTIVDTERGLARTLTTDQAGEYNAPTLIPGTYTVRAEAKGFKKFERQNVFLGVGKEVQVDLIVQTGAQEQTITVSESIPLVETTNATLGGTLNNADIQDMPLNGRNYQNLLSLRPGVMTYAGGSPWTQSTNNSRPDESVWMLDGVLNVNLYDYRPISGMPSPFTDGATILPVDAIQEFNLEENPKAEYGWRPGAVVNVGIKSGTNTLHGSAYGFYRSGNWAARNVFNAVPNPKAPTQLKQFGGVVGGPIKKDKLFYFAGYEGLRSLVGNPISATVPASGSAGATLDPANFMQDAITTLQNDGFTALCTSANTPGSTKCLSPASLALFGCTGTPGTPGTYTCGGSGNVIQGGQANTTNYNFNLSNTNVSDNGIGKMDYRINSKHMLNGMVLVGNYFGDGADHPVVNTYWKNGDPIRTYTITGNWIWTPSSRLVNEARFGWDLVHFGLVPDDASKFANGTDYPLNTGVTTTGGFPVVTFSGFSGTLGSWRGRPVEFSNPYYDIQDNLSYLTGKHTFKFGVEFAHIEADPNIHDTRGRIDFQGNKITGLLVADCSNGTKSCPLEDFFAGSPSRATQLVGTTLRTLRWMNYAAFVEDDWRVTSKLIFNLGMRWSYTSPIKDVNGLLGNFDPARGMVQQGQASVGDTLWKPDHKNFSPRLGFAYDLSGKGTTVVRGGFSTIYSIFTPAQFMQSPFQNFKGGAISATPTGGCTTIVTPPNPCPQTFGGTIDLGVAAIPASSIHWDGVALPAGAGVSCTTAGPCNLTTVNPNLRTPYMTSWSLGITHAFTNNLSLELGYVGNHGSRLTGFVDLNQIDPTNPLENAPGTGVAASGICFHCEDATHRPFGTSYPYLQFIDQTTNDARSNYHSLQATLTQRTSHGLSYTAGYTFGHGLDNGSLNRFGNLPQNSRDPMAEYGNSDFDIRHRLTVTVSYDIPGVKGYGQLLEGWKLNSIVTMQGGLPWLVDDNGNDFSGSGQDLGDRWNFSGNPADFRSGANSIPYCTGFGITGGTNIGDGMNGSLGKKYLVGGTVDTSKVSCSSQSGVNGLVTNYPASFANACTAVAADLNTLAAGGCFVSGSSVMTPPKLGTYGTMARNIFRDSGFRNVDFSVFKTFTYRERFSAQFRVELFNVFNHPLISNPYGAANGAQLGYDPSGASSFGCGCATPDVAAGNPLVGSGSSRVMQLGLKLTF
jgi:hypothetical protein